MRRAGEREREGESAGEREMERERLGESVRQRERECVCERVNEGRGA